MRRAMIGLLLVALAATAVGRAASRPASGDLTAYQNIPLWDEGKVPLAAGTGPLDAPFLTAFLPPEGRRNGASVVIAPGGANIMLMYGGEGLDIAERYNEWGVTAFVLTYRLVAEVRREREDRRREARHSDRSRARERVEARSANRIGYIGFSAGSSMGRAVTAASGPGIPSSRRSDRSRQLAPRLPCARLRRRTRDARRVPEGLSSDVSPVGSGRSGTDARQRAAADRFDQGWRRRGTARVSEGTPRLRQRLRQRGVRRVDAGAETLPDGRRVPAGRGLALTRVAAVMLALAWGRGRRPAVVGADGQRWIRRLRAGAGGIVSHGRPRR